MQSSLFSDLLLLLLLLRLQVLSNDFSNFMNGFIDPAGISGADAAPPAHRGTPALTSTGAGPTS